MKTKSDKPVIGITLCLDRDGLIRKGIDYSFIRSEYGEQVKAAGGLPIFLDYTIDPEAAAELCDGIIISGGEDIDPALYGQPHAKVRVTEPLMRSLWDRQLIDACDKQGIRILGVCYGAQILNVHYGGTLYQEITEQMDNVLHHGSTTQAAMREVTFETEFCGYKVGQTVEVACRHHQAIKDLAPGMNVAGKSSDGVIEAVAGYGHIGIQWHPEADGTAGNIYSSFISSVRDKNTQQRRESVIKHLLQRVYPEKPDHLRRTRR